MNTQATTTTDATIEDALELAAHHPAIPRIIRECDDRPALIAAWAALHEKDPRKSAIVADVVQKHRMRPLAAIEYVKKRLASGPHESLDEFVADYAHNCGPLSSLDAEDAEIAARYFNYNAYWATEMCKEWDVYKKIDGSIFALSKAESLFADDEDEDEA